MDLNNGSKTIYLPLENNLPGAGSTNSNIHTRCRLCVSRGEGMVPIFSEEGKGLELAYKINKLLPTMVTPFDKLPQEVCRKCITNLNVAFDFVRKCMLSQSRLRKMLKIQNDDWNVSIQVIQDYSTNWSPEACVKNIRNVHKHLERRTKRHLTQTAGVSNGETERNGQLKKLKLECKNKLQSKTIPIKTLNSMDVCGIETPPITSSSETVSNYDISVHSDSVSESVSIEAKAPTDCFSENSAAEGQMSQGSATSSDCKHTCKFCGKGFAWKADLFDHQTSVHSDVVFRCSFCLKVFYEKEALDAHELAHMKLLPSGCKVRKQVQWHTNKTNQGEKLVMTSSFDKNQLDPLVMSETSDKCNSAISNEKSEIKKSCKYCNRTFASLKMLRKHIRFDHKFRLPCRFCPTTCPSIYELTKHEARHRKSSKYLICKKCEKYFDTVDELRGHELIHLHVDGLKCEVCAETFVSEVSLEEHIKSHGGESTYLCEMCGQNFESFFIFRFHKMCHIYSDMQKCEICNSCFHGAANLESHLEVVHKKKRHQCRVCEKKFISVELLREHKVEHHKTEHKCESCGKTFPTAKKLKNHAQTHSSERNYLCEKCGKDFKLNSSLHKHRYLCQVTVSCNICDRKFDSTTRLKIHMRIHTGEKPYVCAVCGKGFHATWALNQHMVLHDAIKFPCPICGTLFNRKANMVTHMMRHRVACDTCGQMFANTPVLQAHLKEHVENGERADDIVPSKSYKCSDCGKLFVTSLDLKAHLPSHSDATPHQCNLCEKSFRRLKALRKHMLTHSGRKPYQCRFCTCTFVVHQRLLKHEKGHTVGKPYVCQVCGQGFWSPLNLEKHSFRHCASSSTEQIYHCNYCEKSFAVKSSLLIHKRTHTSQLTYSCSFCPRKFSRLKFMQRHKCALNPNPEGSDSSLQKGILPSLPILTDGSAEGGDNIFPVSVLNEEIVYDMESSASYAEIIVISQNIDEFIGEDDSELNE